MRGPPFVMSKYSTLKDLYADKAKYWQAIAIDALKVLEVSGDASQDVDGYWVWNDGSGYVGERGNA